MPNYLVLNLGNATRDEIVGGKPVEAWIETATDMPTASTQAAGKRGAGRYAISGAGALNVFNVQTQETYNASQEP